MLFAADSRPLADGYPTRPGFRPAVRISSWPQRHLTRLRRHSPALWWRPLHRRSYKYPVFTIGPALVPPSQHSPELVLDWSSGRIYKISPLYPKRLSSPSRSLGHLRRDRALLVQPLVEPETAKASSSLPERPLITCCLSTK